MSDDTVQTPPQEWLDTLNEGLADIAAGRGSPWPEARARLAALQDALKTVWLLRRYRKKGRKYFFFEKKKQKTFIRCW
jgi:hypothetical protein